MFGLKFYVLTAVICSLMVSGQGDLASSPTIIIPVPSKSSDAPPASSAAAIDPLVPDASEHTTKSTTSTTITTESPKPTTTSAEPTTTSTEPTTTSTAPTTTSTEPTTTSTQPTTTSTKPSTTSPKPGPTPAPPTPGPLPPPDQGTWSYSEKNVTCVVVQFAAQLNLTYTKNTDNATVLDNVLLNIPVNASVTAGDCNSTEKQWLTISWPVVVANRTLLNNLTLLYHNNATTKQYSLQNLNISLVGAAIPNTTYDVIELWHGAEWQAPVGASYRCAAATRLNMTAEQANVVAALTLSRLQEEAFRTQSGNGFSAARDCAGGDVPDAVPIAVGCALGGLVVVVLVAYLVGRRRSAARGYLSM